jgi:hypothetical protein
MTNDLVESLVGHRTRLAQADPARWHDDEDTALAGYLSASARMDGTASWLDALAPSGWIVLGLLGLAPALVSGPADSAAIAVSVGGVLLAYGSLRQLVAGVSALAGAGIAWDQVRALFWAAERGPARARRARPPHARPDGWRARVVTAPQFHENHVLGGTVAFNLLMGRTWPPRDEDLADAEAVCRELGLGPLLERMPSGLSQMIGETGWQLSHGEKSRLFIARALLQNADVVVLDESLAALDPDNLRRALRCVFARARAVVVISHP